MIELLVLIALWGVFQPSAGTYALVQDGSAIIRMDTRTGKIERCEIESAILKCYGITEATSQRP